MRKAVAAAIGVIVVGVAVWFFAFRHKAEAPAPAAQGSAAKIDLNVRAPAATESDKPSPRGVAPKWTLDTDPEGPLRLEGQVVDGDGKGIGGVDVTLESVPPRTAKSEDDGTFAFDKLVGRAYELTASKGELVGGPVTYKLTGKSDPVVIRIGRGAAIEAKVADEKGQPIANAAVEVPDDAHHGAKTDDKGQAKIVGVRPGWVSVEASAPGYAPASTFTSVGSAGATGHVSLTLHKGAAVAGRVIDESGKPIAKARVTSSELFSARHDRNEQTTDDKGQFSFPALAPGRHTLKVIDGEHAPGQSNPITVVVDKPVTGVEVVMKTGGTLAGTVVDADGKPQPYATVRVAGKGADMWREQSRQATTDQQGKFELRGLARAKLQARAESDTAASKLVDLDFTSQLALRDQKLMLDVTGTIVGSVVDEAGQAVAEVQVNAFPDILAGASAEGLALAGMSSATTDGAGAFKIHGLPDGAYRLWAARRDEGMEGGWGKQSTAAKVGDKNVRIVLPAPGVLVGKLVLETGAAPKTAFIHVGGRASTPASPTGEFRLEDLAPGPYDLHVLGPEFAEYAKHDIKIEPGKTTDLGSITVVRGRKLVGKVVDNAGSPVAGARVKLGEMLISGANGEDDDMPDEDMSGIRSGMTDQDGTFSLPGVPQKATSVMADHPDRGRSVPAAVPAGMEDPPAMTIALRGYGSIAGKVVMKGQPQANVAVSESVKGGAGMQASFAETAADGTFTMTKVAEGTHVLNAIEQQMMAMRTTSTTVQVKAGQQTTVTIDIPVGSIALDVQIKPMANQQVDAAQVFLLAGTVAISNAKQLGDGFFQGGMQGMKFWFSKAPAPPEYSELVPGDYSVCSVPITGDLSDSTFQQRLQENMQSLKVYCKAVKVAAAPTTQTVVQELPAMAPLPAPKS
jgi:uncharacterized GH25 family protein